MSKPIPPVEHRFKPGQSGNPGGKSSSHRKAEVKAAELAATIQLDLVEALADVLANTQQSEEKLVSVKADILRLLKDVQDRAFGTASQHVDNTSSDGSAVLPSRIMLVGPE